VTSYFLSESATITPRSQKNPIKGKSVFKIPHPPTLTNYLSIIRVMVADSERKYDVTANCHVTPFKLKRDNSYSNL
jgi:hypothetical protein